MLDMQVERWRHGSCTGGSNDKMLDSLWAGVVIEADLIWILGGRFLIKTYLDYSRLYVFRCTSDGFRSNEQFSGSSSTPTCFMVKLHFWLWNLHSLFKSSSCCCFQVDSLQDLVRPSMSMERGWETMVEMALLSSRNFQWDGTDVTNAICLGPCM